MFSHTSLIRHRSSVASRFLAWPLLQIAADDCASLVEFLIIGKEFCLVLTTNEHELTRIQGNERTADWGSAPASGAGFGALVETIFVFYRRERRAFETMNKMERTG
jgi:hypothetical protein